MSPERLDSPNGERAYAALAASEARYRRLFESARDGILILDADTGRIVEANPFMTVLTGYSRKEFLERYLWEIGPFKAIAASKEAFAELQAKEYVPYEDLPLKTHDDRTVGVEFISNVYLIDDQRVIQCNIRNIRDISDRKCTEGQLRSSEQRLAGILSNMQDVVWSLSWPDMGILFIGDAAEWVFGRSAQDFYARPTLRQEVIHPDDASTLETALKEQLQPRSAERTCRIVRPDGTIAWTQDRSQMVLDESGRPIRVDGIVTDITERKQSEREFLESKQLTEAVVENVPLMIFLKEAQELRYVLFNQGGEDLVGYDRNELLGKNDADLFPPEQAAFFTAMDREVLAAGGRMDISEEPLLTARNGTRLFHTKKLRINGADGVSKYLLGISEDITERKQAEETLAASEARYRSYIDATGQIGWVTNPNGEVVEDVPALRHFTGQTVDEVRGSGWTKALDPDDLEHTMQAWTSALATKRGYEVECRLRRYDGVYRHFLARGAPVFREDGSVREWVRTCLDITERKAMETERDRLEEQLRASRRMEAIGSLAGGVAHDFNNLLSVILSYTGFAMDEFRDGDPIKNDLLELTKAADRAVALIQQLLAFSRKQVLQPVPLDLNQIAAGVEKMLRRILGEDIDFLQVLAPDLALTLADPGQIEQVLMNLVVNARDAMPGGGKLTIETSNVEIDEEYAARHVAVTPGSYVQLMVTDTGFGMDKNTKDRLFEPFFTTKEKGKGTGLGLSTVYGIVKQSGGNIWVHSEVGKGSTFKVYLPRHFARDTARVIKAPTAPKQITGTETILVVEDEDALRKVALRTLGAAGYTVLTAGNGEEALLTAARHAGAIHLLLTDVVLPRMSGRVLAQELSRKRPSVKVLYMSGYTDDAIVHHGVLDAGTQFLAKPFTGADLTRKVRAVLDGGEPRTTVFAR